MKSLFRAFCLFIVAMYGPWCMAQSDINVSPANTRTPYITIGRGLVWGVGVNNNFIFPVLNPDQRICLYVVNNNPSNSHTYALAVSQSPDPSATTFIGNAARWSSVSIQPPSTTVLVNANSVQVWGVHTTSAARVAIQFSASGTQAGAPDTADIFAIQTTSETCGDSITTAKLLPTNLTTNFCNQNNASTGVTAIGVYQITGVPSATQNVYICSFSLYGGTEGATAGAVQIIYGTGSTCTTPTTIFSFPLVASQVISPVAWGGVNLQIPVGKTLCAQITQTLTAGTAWMTNFSIQ